MLFCYFKKRAEKKRQQKMAIREGSEKLIRVSDQISIDQEVEQNRIAGEKKRQEEIAEQERLAEIKRQEEIAEQERLAEIKRQEEIAEQERRAEQIYYKEVVKQKRSEIFLKLKQIDNIIEDAKKLKLEYNQNLYKYDYSTLKLHEEHVQFLLKRNECFPLIDFLKEKCDLEIEKLSKTIHCMRGNNGIGFNTFNYVDPFIETARGYEGNLKLIRENYKIIMDAEQKLLSIQDKNNKNFLFNECNLKVGDDICLVKYFLNGYLKVIDIADKGITVISDSFDTFKLSFHEVYRNILVVKNKAGISYINLDSYMIFLKELIENSICKVNIEIKTEVPFIRCCLKMQEKHIYHLFGYKRDEKYKFLERTRLNATQIKDKPLNILYSNVLVNSLIENNYKLFKINEPIGLVKGEWALYSKYGEIEIVLIIENEYPKSFMVFNNANQQFANKALEKQVEYKIREIRTLKLYSDTTFDLRELVQSYIHKYEYFPEVTSSTNFELISLNETIVDALRRNNHLLHILRKNLKYI